MSSIPAISVVDVHKSFGPLAVLKGVSFDVPRGSVVSMIGASGSGKSTLLRCINHLETPSAGEIYIDGEPMHFRVAGDGQRKPRPIAEINRLRRDLGMVFQQFNLWPHMTVLGNVTEAPQRVRGMSRREAMELGEACLARVHLQGQAAAFTSLGKGRTFMLELMEHEIQTSLGLLGVTRWSELDGSYLHPAVPVPPSKPFGAFPLLTLDEGTFY